MDRIETAQNAAAPSAVNFVTSARQAGHHSTIEMRRRLITTVRRRSIVISVRFRTQHLASAVMHRNLAGEALEVLAKLSFRARKFLYEF